MPLRPAARQNAVQQRSVQRCPRTLKSAAARTLGLPILRGRPFTPLDGTAGHENAIVNGRFASMFFPDSDPIGRRIRLTNPNVIAQELPWLTIVGVSPTVRQMARTGAPDPVVYYPFRGDSGFFARLIVRGAAGAGVTAAIREEIRKLNPDLPLFDPLPLEAAVNAIEGGDHCIRFGRRGGHRSSSAGQPPCG